MPRVPCSLFCKIFLFNFSTLLFKLFAGTIHPLLQDAAVLNTLCQLLLTVSFPVQLIEKWYPSVEQGTKKGVLLVVTTSKEGALTGGPSFLKVSPRCYLLPENLVVQEVVFLPETDFANDKNASVSLNEGE